jgi:hypothetical protein
MARPEKSGRAIDSLIEAAVPGIGRHHSCIMFIVQTVYPTVEESLSMVIIWRDFTFA